MWTSTAGVRKAGEEEADITSLNVLNEKARRSLNFGDILCASLASPIMSAFDVSFRSEDRITSVSPQQLHKPSFLTKNKQGNSVVFGIDHLRLPNQALDVDLEVQFFGRSSSQPGSQFVSKNWWFAERLPCDIVPPERRRPCSVAVKLTFSGPSGVYLVEFSARCQTHGNRGKRCEQCQEALRTPLAGLLLK
eukprot:m.184536 g.184536  ORF g.184536 m.184536 type:complete len:192 (+) comp39325_c0_seq5:90-665(+)